MDIPALIFAVVATVVFVGGLVWFSMRRYNRLNVDASGIQFGQETLPWSEIDTSFGIQGPDALTDEARAIASGPMTPMFVKRHKEKIDSAGVRVVGGSYGTGALSSVVLRHRDGTHLILPTATPGKLRETLEASWPGAT